MLLDAGKRKVVFCKRLGDSWRKLALYLEIPSDESDRFTPGDEGWEILKWLENRNLLDTLPEALDFIGREDLALVLQPPPAPEATAQRWQGSPFPGLRPFTAEEAPVFFGRGRHIHELLERLSNPRDRFIAVVGASGSGKSSVVAAGLLPCLQQDAIPGSKEWVVREFTPGGPGNDPFHALPALLEPC